MKSCNQNSSQPLQLFSASKKGCRAAALPQLPPPTHLEVVQVQLPPAAAVVYLPAPLPAIKAPGAAARQLGECQEAGPCGGACIPSLAAARRASQAVPWCRYRTGGAGAHQPYVNSRACTCS